MDDNKDKITEQKPEAVDEPKETLNDQKDSTVSDLLHVFDLSLLIKEVRQETKQEKKATSVQKTTNKKGVVIASLCVVGLVVMFFLIKFWPNMTEANPPHADVVGEYCCTRSPMMSWRMGPENTRSTNNIWDKRQATVVFAYSAQRMIRGRTWLGFGKT